MKKETPSYEELLQVKQKFDSLTENINIGVFTSTLDGKFIDVNSPIVEIGGYDSKEEFMGIHASQLYANGEDREAIIAELTSKGYIKNKEVLSVKKDGTTYWISMNIILVTDDDGKPVNLFGTIEDISENREREEKLRFLSSISQQVTDSVIATDLQFKIVFVNRATVTMFGYSEEELLGETPDFLNAEPISKEIQEEIYSTVGSGGTWKGSHLNRKKDGSVFFNEMTISPMFDSKGGIISYISIQRDVTNQKNAEHALRDSESKYRTLLENLPQRIFLKNAQSQYLSCNRNYANDLGINPDDIEGKDDFDFYTEDFAKKYREDDRRVIESGEIEEIEESYAPETGDNWFVHTVKVPIKDEDGNVWGLMGIFWDITERKEAESRLKFEKERSEQYLDIAEIGLGVIAHDEKLSLLNRKGAAILGYEQEEIIGKNWFDLVVPSDIREMIRGVFRQLMSGESEAIEYYENELVRKDGKTILLSFHNTVVEDENGNTFGALFSFEDITERKKAETELIDAKTKSEMYLDMAGTMLVSLNTEGEILLCNRKGHEILGYENGQLVGRNWFDTCLSEPETERVRKVFNSILQGNLEEAIYFENKVLTSNGEERLIAWNNRADYDEKGNFVFLISSGEDITERRKAEEDLRTSESFLNSVIDQNCFPIWISDADGTLIRANEALRQLLNVTDDQIVGKFNVLKDPVVKKQGLLDKFRKVYEDGIPVDFEIDWYGEDDEAVEWGDANPVSIEGALFPLHDQAGKFTNAVMTYRDISDRKEREAAEKKVLEQEKMVAIGKVAGKMAHDFNNLLGIIMGTSQLLMTEDISEDIKSEIQIVIDSALKGRDLTQNLLLFAKDQEPKLSRFDLNEKINTLIRSLKSELESVRVNLSFDADMPDLVADPGLLDNALVNIIQNSIHAMSKTERPVLSIRTYSVEKFIFVEIEDNGCGIPDKFKGQIFDPTVTLKGINDRSGMYRKDIKGSGYGLANVKRCIDKHDGRIEVNSKEGAGTTFKLTFRVIEDELSPEEMKTVQDMNVKSGKRILLVEDEPQFARILYSLLSKLDHNVDLATDGAMALDHARRNEYELISLDYILPDTDGMKVYREIRKMHKDVPIVFVSGNFEFMQSMIDLKKEDTKVDHLAKPFDVMEYIGKISEWMKDD